MYTIQFSVKSRPRACHTCRYLRCVEHHPKDNQHPEPYCGYADPAPLNADLLTQTWCIYWEKLPEPQSVRVFEELVGVTL